MALGPADASSEENILGPHWWVVAIVAALHLAGLWALVAGDTPMPEPAAAAWLQVAFLTPAVEPSLPPPRRMERPTAPPRPAAIPPARRPPQPRRVVAAPSSPDATAFTVPPPAVEAAEAPADTALRTVAPAAASPLAPPADAGPSPAAAAPPVPAPAPLIPATAVAYRVPPPIAVPLASRRLGESGTVWLRVRVGRDGLPLQVALHRSSGHDRLDQQALAAMRNARFEPQTDNGQAIEWQVIAPLQYDID